eukprot:TRINITY_DN1593_c0_g1_i2.p1 TRINITY_DN1593_c0_g1~~TRINITY_DN1593_c0_g1_i2.p1  ORF type:complete len:200 (-),score=26.00 TRINITY_DN1593_c0_g1_i2:70-669(-)
MKFRFCGELDAPDWLLREISSLARLTNIRVKLLALQVIDHLLGGKLDFEKIGKLVAPANFDLSDIKGALAALNFIVGNAAKYDVADDILSTELQQLGLPKEHCGSLGRSLRNHRDNLRKALQDQILHLPQLSSVDWRVDFILSSSDLRAVNTPSVQICLNVKGPNGKITPQPFEIDAEKFRVLYYELKDAQSSMESFNV